MLAFIDWAYFKTHLHICTWSHAFFFLQNSVLQFQTKRFGFSNSNPSVLSLRILWWLWTYNILTQQGYIMKKVTKTFSSKKLVWKTVWGRTVYFRRKKKSFDHSIMQRGVAVSYASDHAPHPSCSGSEETLLWIHSTSVCASVLLLHRTTHSSYHIRLLQVRTVMDTLRKQGFHDTQPVGEGAVWVWVIQLLIEVMTTKSLMWF